MSDTILEYSPLLRHWPKFDTAHTVFRYALAREMCRGKRVLEIGAAAGEGTVFLADAAEVTAIDHQNLWSHSPAASLPNVRFEQRDALDLPTEWDGRFDVVVALELIEHLPDPAAFQRAVHRVLAKDGILVLSTPNFDLYSLSGDDSRTPVFQHHLREYRIEELEAAAADIWDYREISCVSQLTFPDGAGGKSNYVFLRDATFHDVTLGEKYPEYQVHETGRLPSPMNRGLFQNFLMTLGKGTRRPEAEPRFPVRSTTAPFSLTEAAFRSCHVILQRKNENCRWLQDCVSHLEKVEAHLRQDVANQREHIEGQQQYIAGQRKVVEDQQQYIADQQRQLTELSDLVRQKEAALVETLGELWRTSERLENILKWTPRRLAGRLARKLKIRDLLLGSDRAKANR
jgi:SAM-dependent methyltransferase